MSYFKIFQDKQGQYRWTFHAGNHKVLAGPGESFTRRASAEENIERVQNYALQAPIHDRTKSDSDGHHSQGGTAEFEIYQDRAKEYRWRLQSGNNKIISKSSEGYNAKSDCIRCIELLKKFIPKAEVKDETRRNKSSQGRRKTSTESREGRFA